MMTGRLVTVRNDLAEGVGQPAPFGVSVYKISGVGPLSGRHTDGTTLTLWRTEDDPEWSFVHPRTHDTTDAGDGAGACYGCTRAAGPRRS